MQETSNCPRLPRIASLLGGRVPVGLIGKLIEPALNRSFSTAIADGQLDELSGRELAIVIDDLDIALGFRLRDGRLQAGTPRQAATSIRGPLAAYLRLASGDSDADSLFFNRQLVMEGDTDLGLIVKNTIDATGIETLPAALRTALRIAARLIPAQEPGKGSSSSRTRMPASPNQ